MTTSPQDPNPRRGATRAPVGRPIKLQFDDSMDVIEGVCRNISIGGMFISFEDARPAGSLVRFELELDDDSAVRGLGEVVWMRSKNEAGGPESGFGLKFRFLEQRDRQLIFKLVSQHIKERLSKRPHGTGSAAPAAPEVAAPKVAAPPEPAPETPEPAPEAPAPAAADPPEQTAAELEPPASEPPPAAPPPEPAAGALELPFEPPPAASAREELLPALDDMSAPELEPGDHISRPSDHPGELDPAIGQTPMYELGLKNDPSLDDADRFDGPAEARESVAAAPAGLGSAGLSDRDAVVSSGTAARSRRRFPVLPVIVVVLAAVAAAAYLYKDELSARFGGAPAVAAAGDRQADEQPTGAEPNAGVEPEPAASVEPPPPSSAPPPPASAPPPAAAPPPPAAPPPARRVPSAGFTRLVDVAWRQAGGGLEVTLTTDGAIADGRYRHFRIGGEAPREVVRLIGTGQRYAKSQLEVGGPGVQRIRIGYHRAAGSDEIHVVMDLTGPRWRITEVVNAGDRLELSLRQQ